MRRILDRYIFREIAWTWAGVTVVLLLILLINQFARILGDVAKGRLPKDAAMDVIVLSAAQYMTVLVPIGLFLAVMLALGRLYRDSQMPAMMACRVGPSGVYRPLLWLLVPLVGGVAWLSIDLGPRSLLAVDRIGAEARRQADLASIEPGRFTQVGVRNAVVYGERITEDGQMINVFLQRQVDDEAIEVVVAKRGEQDESEDPDVRFLVLHEGRRYEGIPGIPYHLPSLDPPEATPRVMSLAALIRAGGLEHIAELQWRLGVPIATIILSILAVPLSRTQPREGRYGRLAIGLLIFIIYLNMLSASKAWIEQGKVSPLFGLWWVHAAALALGIGLLAIQNGVHRRLFR